MSAEMPRDTQGGAWRWSVCVASEGLSQRPSSHGGQETRGPSSGQKPLVSLSVSSVFLLFLTNPIGSSLDVSKSELLVILSQRHSNQKEGSVGSDTSWTSDGQARGILGARLRHGEAAGFTAVSETAWALIRPLS